jgi:hypothetical protein
MPDTWFEKKSRYISLKINSLQSLVRNFFAPASGMLWGLFAILRTNCEEFAKKGKLSLCSVPKKVGKKLVGTRLVRSSEWLVGKRQMGSGE